MIGISAKEVLSISGKKTGMADAFEGQKAAGTILRGAAGRGLAVYSVRPPDQIYAGSGAAKAAKVKSVHPV